MRALRYVFSVLWFSRLLRKIPAPSPPPVQQKTNKTTNQIALRATPTNQLADNKVSMFSLCSMATSEAKRCQSRNEKKHPLSPYMKVHGKRNAKKRIAFSTGSISSTPTSPSNHPRKPQWWTHLASYRCRTRWELQCRRAWASRAWYPKTLGLPFPCPPRKRCLSSRSPTKETKRIVTNSLVYISLLWFGIYTI